MRRRGFITLLGSAAVAWPRSAPAQQGEHMRRIGVLINLASDNPEPQAQIMRIASSRGLKSDEPSLAASYWLRSSRPPVKRAGNRCPSVILT